ncbi:hypothetical protein CQW23_34070 [Capsicum baccatum]|uniref:Uncharacterized protein n=1 Tax=Capsicum baccatum TaxID=33114 RepID=A0A2G2UZZ8_CAPBA|nr:hypothetical protein CQW23_34070 [Capsicum baccatum]
MHSLLFGAICHIISLTLGLPLCALYWKITYYYFSFWRYTPRNDDVDEETGNDYDLEDPSLAEIVMDQVGLTDILDMYYEDVYIVSLIDILDMYYEDMYTLPYKELTSTVVAKSFKRSISVSKAISMALASGVFLVAIRILGQCYLPHFPIEKYPVNSSDMITIQHQSMESCELEDYCVSVVRRIKEFYRWPGDIGELPMYLKQAMYSKDSDLNSSSTQSEGIEDELNKDLTSK